MANKALRILIADSRHSQTLLVERMLNRLGYYRIATASSLAEVHNLGHCSGYPIDILIGSAWLLSSGQTVRDSQPGIYHNALIYQCHDVQVGNTLSVTEGTVARLPFALDTTSLGMFMALIDPQAVHNFSARVGIECLALCPQREPPTSIEKNYLPIVRSILQ